MARAGFELRHQTQGVNVPMYQTSMACRPAGAFAGPMVVSMRPVQANRVPEVCEITARYPSVHGAPVHAGDPATIGIQDINQPDWGDPLEIRPGEVPVFWGCGVTPQGVAQASRPTLIITHAPGHMSRHRPAGYAELEQDSAQPVIPDRDGTCFVINRHRSLRRDDANVPPCSDPKHPAPTLRHTGASLWNSSTRVGLVSLARRAQQSLMHRHPDTPA